MKDAVHDTLKAMGRTSAAEIAEAMGMPLEAVYVELVRLEAEGLARVIGTHPTGTSMPRCYWRACHRPCQADIDAAFAREFAQYHQARRAA